MTEEQTILNSLKNGELNLDTLDKKNLERVLDILGRMSIVKARTDFHTYVKLMADELIPTGFVDGRHIRLICKELQEVEQSIRDSHAGKCKYAKRKQFFLPPGAMKSLLISVLFVSWFLGRNPKFRVLQLGYSTDFAIDNFGRKVKDIIASSQRFRAVFPETQLKSDTRSAQRFELTLGGGYFCVGATGGIAGRRAHLLICDDVISEQTAYSDVERTKITRWYIPGARSRLLPNSSEVIVNTRWHVDDLSAYLLKVDGESKNPWRIISIPALLDEEGSKLLSLPKGTSFWPELYPTSYFELQKDSYYAAGESARWSALFMQNPIPEEGNVVKREYFRFWSKKNPPPPCHLIVASVDTAFETTKRADYSAITVWGVFESEHKGHNGFSYSQNNVILLDAKRGKWELKELIDEIEDVMEVYPVDWMLIEKKASGISVIQELRQNPRIPLWEIIPDKDKMTRLHAALPTFRAGGVWFPEETEYTDAVTSELLQFPAGKNDDFVDSTTQAINWMRKNLVLSRKGERGYTSEDEEDDTTSIKRKSYWAALQG